MVAGHQRARVLGAHLKPSEAAASSLEEVYIVSAVRTPLGTFGGGLSAMSAPQLGGVAIKEAVKRAGITPGDVQEIFMGNVLSANLGQAPARQASKAAGLPDSVIATTVNKVCSSGLKSIMLASQSIMLGQQHCVVAGGMESMSNAPFCLPDMRWGHKLNNTQAVDTCVQDGLWDPYGDQHMGGCAEICAEHHKVSRGAQDEYALRSYARAQAANSSGKATREIVPVTTPGRRGKTISCDEQISKMKADRMSGLKPVFKPEGGTVTAGNASPISDGAAAVVLVSGTMLRQLKLTPIAKVRGFADAEQEPTWFTTAPSVAIPKAIANAGLNSSDIDFYEINEAFSVVSLANNELLNLDPSRVNVYGGAVAMGHPLGCSGARIVVTLCSVLAQEKGKFGAVGICNGGGGASAMVIERC